MALALSPANKFAFSLTSVKLWMVVGGDNSQTLAVSEFASDFVWNSVPSAVVTVPVGYGIAPAGVDSTPSAPTFLEQFFLLPATVYGEFTGDDDLARGQFKLFEGYIASMSPGEIGTHGSMSVKLVHWCSLFGSMNWQRPDLHPDSVVSLANIYSTASSSQAGASAEAASIRSKVQDSLEAKLRIAGSADLWGGVGEAVKRLVEEEDPKTSMAANEYKEILVQLIDKFDTEELEDRVSMSMRAVPSDGGVKLREAIASRLLDSIHSNGWASLSRVAALLQVPIVVTVNSMAMVPSVPTIREYWRVLRPDDYVQCQLQAQLGFPLKGVRFIGTAKLNSGLNITLELSATGSASYENEAVKCGQVLIQSVPSWLYADFVTKAEVAGAQHRDDSEAAASAETSTGASASILQNYGKTVYAHHVFAHSTASVTGRLRFDIAPGSTIKLIQRQLDTEYAGLVTTVRTHISATTKRASTSFGLASVHPVELSWTLTEHPFYNEVHVGSQLVNASGG